MNDILLKDRLRELRTSMHFTQQFVSQYLNMTRQGYAHYEAGLRTPDYQILLKISRLYHVDINYLINSNTYQYDIETLCEHENYMCQTSPEDNRLSSDEQKLLHLFRQLSAPDKAELFTILEHKTLNYKD